MRMLLTVLTLILASGASVQAGGWYEPQRGSALRRDLMDALRPHAWWRLGGPVEFVVNELRVSGDVAFAMVVPQRPGGGAIDPATTPMALREGYDPEYMEGFNMEALYVKSGNMWVVVDFAIGATDVWWADGFHCADWAAVIPEVCGD
ncbi:hypothetical protein [Thalassovita mangrovi]|uniref:Uncharacterized protein n=1 Tax=Thalassovita mangrovi TaxID=2692236 RepID=A0A6L8LMH7_9RHOB|nr:hypothetical protein [Thalassovita mangrovi]MYM54852.1 hypothetical protein [Thalassovita mangrovi]